MATWSVWVKATRDGIQKYHAAHVVAGDSESQAKSNAVAKAEKQQASYRGCLFLVTSAVKVRDN